MNIWGTAVGLFSFLLIGLLHPVVIKAEYYFGKQCWPLFLVGGIACLIVALTLQNLYISVAFGIAGFSLFWSIKELYAQEERVRKGWYPANPKNHTSSR